MHSEGKLNSNFQFWFWWRGRDCLVCGHMVSCVEDLSIKIETLNLLDFFFFWETIGNWLLVMIQYTYIKIFFFFGYSFGFQLYF